jgi:peptidoglycan/xylan/chitin deacetylase (PgdA/CDA1 family)
VRVICFHDVADATWFEGVLSMLVKEYTIIAPAQFHQREFNSEKINILLTFDDGYQSWVDNCLPVLQKYTAKAIFFINSGLLDVAQDQSESNAFIKNRLYISPKNPLTWEGTRTLVAAGHTIGGHTVTHPNLALLDIEEVQKEVIEDKKRIESMLHVSLLDFAYPFGRSEHWNESVRDSVLSAPYSFVYTADSGYVDLTQSHTINRVCIEKDQPLSSIMWWIEGGYDIFKWHI